MIIRGIVLDPVYRRRFNGEIHVQNGKIEKITEVKDAVPSQFIMPGFIDAHIHIESSMLIPSQFARLAVQHGTVATISDPHEIANVCGLEGVHYMIDDGAKVPLKFHFGAPSCVPATQFETAGAELSVSDVATLLDREDIYYLAEMMNWPGVLQRDNNIMAMIKASLERGKPIDGHAPGLIGKESEMYCSAGISTDHECFTLDEATDKIRHGMKILIREGSAAKNYDALHPLLKHFPEMVMFCSDDKHPDDLIKGHINELVARSLDLGYDLFDVLWSACVHPVLHYNMAVGLLRPGDDADFIVVENLEKMNVLQTWIQGNCVFDQGEVTIPEVEAKHINHFMAYELQQADFMVKATGEPTPIIVAFDGELITGKELIQLPEQDECIQVDLSRDVLKIAVVNRYKKAKPAVGFIQNFGLKSGAIASSVGHDSHNIIAVGCDDASLSRAVNLIMHHKGGISLVDGAHEDVLPLPVAGIMTTASGHEVAYAYERLSIRAKQMGSTLKAPFMLISFMALLVIPKLKMSDLGLFDGEKFRFIS